MSQRQADTPPDLPLLMSRQQIFQAGRRVGEVEALRRVVAAQLSSRFGPQSTEVRERLRVAPVDQLERWALRLLDASRIADVCGV